MAGVLIGWAFLRGLFLAYTRRVPVYEDGQLVGLLRWSSWGTYFWRCSVGAGPEGVFYVYGDVGANHDW